MCWSTTTRDKPGRGLIWFEHLNQAPWFKEHALGPEGVGVSHGSGIGDINGDGRDDVVTTSGWFEAPARPAEQPWIWHPDYQFSAFGAPGRPGGAGLPILVTDVNGDGLNDIIMGSDHGYGLAWFEQKIENGKRTFVQHWIETEYPTFHTMALADLDGDGKPELITGKQLLAHNGGDVGALDPVFVFYYKFDKGRFETARPVLQLSGAILRTRLQWAAAELRHRCRDAAERGGSGWRRPPGYCGRLPQWPLRLLQQRRFAENARAESPPGS